MSQSIFDRNNNNNSKHPLGYLRSKLDLYRSHIKLRYDVYDMKHKRVDVGITIPPKLKRQYQSTIGWAAKAVDVLADRLVFREFRKDLFNMNEIFNYNNPDVFFDSAVLSALISSCSFVYISKPTDEYLPRLEVIQGLDATGIIDPVTGLLEEGYAILKKDKDGNAEIEAHFLKDRTDYYQGDKRIESIPNPTNNALLVPIIHRPDAVRPFGRSRISKSAIYFQEYASRILERSDITAEFYSFPQKYVVGLSPDAEQLDSWKATVSSLLQFDKDSDGDSPKLGQFSSATMQPFIDQLRQAASGFAGETGLTLDDLGYVSDNPTSAEAIKASHETLRLLARKAQRNFGSGFLNVGYVAVCLRDEFPYQRSQFYSVKPKWENIFEPDLSSLSAIGDGAIKLNQAIPNLLSKETIRDLTGLEVDDE